MDISISMDSFAMFKSLHLVGLLEYRHSEISSSLLLNWCLVFPQGGLMSMKEKNDQTEKGMENAADIKNDTNLRLHPNSSHQGTTFENWSLFAPGVNTSILIQNLWGNPIFRDYLYSCYSNEKNELQFSKFLASRVTLGLESIQLFQENIALAAARREQKRRKISIHTITSRNTLLRLEWHRCRSGFGTKDYDSIAVIEWHLGWRQGLWPLPLWCSICVTMPKAHGQVSVCQLLATDIEEALIEAPSFLEALLYPECCFLASNPNIFVVTAFFIRGGSVIMGSISQPGMECRMCQGWVTRWLNLGLNRGLGNFVSQPGMKHRARSLVMGKVVEALQKNLLNCLQLTCIMLQPAALQTSPVCMCRCFGTVAVHQSLVESLLVNGWSNNRSFLRLSACRLQARVRRKVESGKRGRAEKWMRKIVRINKSQDHIYCAVCGFGILQHMLIHTEMTSFFQPFHTKSGEPVVIYHSFKFRDLSGSSRASSRSISNNQIFSSGVSSRIFSKIQRYWIVLVAGLKTITNQQLSFWKKKRLHQQEEQEEKNKNQMLAQLTPRVCIRGYQISPNPCLSNQRVLKNPHFQKPLINFSNILRFK
ncbi:hypothetical protein VP01_340g2 [Puccinia sorghi]|uniref:Uncharacterized protein n=1 Tax=Puccinia sorghi TaxID=27349 RepID=A0A0L6UXF0_9BASI|nr:hypothetical protein VP01_340g2 [Puccinia sorghi]